MSCGDLEPHGHSDIFPPWCKPKWSRDEFNNQSQNLQGLGTISWCKQPLRPLSHYSPTQVVHSQFEWEIGILNNQAQKVNVFLPSIYTSVRFSSLLLFFPFLFRNEKCVKRMMKTSLILGLTLTYVEIWHSIYWLHPNVCVG